MADIERMKDYISDFEETCIKERENLADTAKIIRGYCKYILSMADDDVDRIIFKAGDIAREYAYAQEIKVKIDALSKVIQCGEKMIDYAERS